MRPLGRQAFTLGLPRCEDEGAVTFGRPHEQDGSLPGLGSHGEESILMHHGDARELRTNTSGMWDAHDSKLGVHGWQTERWKP